MFGHCSPGRGVWVSTFRPPDRSTSGLRSLSENTQTPTQEPTTVKLYLLEETDDWAAGADLLNRMTTGEQNDERQYNWHGTRRKARPSTSGTVSHNERLSCSQTVSWWSPYAATWRGVAGSGLQDPIRSDSRLPPGPSLREWPSCCLPLCRMMTRF
jgi:hypothetical protein